MARKYYMCVFCKLIKKKEIEKENETMKNTNVQKKTDEVFSPNGIAAR